MDRAARHPARLRRGHGRPERSARRRNRRPRRGRVPGPARRRGDRGARRIPRSFGTGHDAVACTRWFDPHYGTTGWRKDWSALGFLELLYEYNPLIQLYDLNDGGLQQGAYYILTLGDGTGWQGLMFTAFDGDLANFDNGNAQPF